ncbi:2-dehydro-3-deoxygalactonokinase [Bordetella tumbae]|uniref:2-dehydro-3-deoxygalactonokinase n=1 Tax=Bordetella tumbae TaxID=1649139 RepID=UPI0039EFE7A3
MTLNTATPAALIALDWGTSSLRAYLLDQTGRTLCVRPLPWGIMRLPEARPGEKSSAHPHAGFEIAFNEACGDWLREKPALPVIACGMVGSAQGWREAAYLDVPVGLSGVAQLMTKIERAGQATIHIVPGLIQRGELPNVMRGEETQIAGILAMRPSDGADLLIGLPGTHSKWVHVHDGQVNHFDTYMTGEVYAALRDHTILGRTMNSDAPADAQGFARGLAVASLPEGRAGLLSTLFSTRALGLTGQLDGNAQPDYLSGLLIGYEVASVLALHRARGALPHIVLCGQDALCQRYVQALRLYGADKPELAPHATELGLWHLAQAAGLVPAATT